MKFPTTKYIPIALPLFLVMVGCSGNETGPQPAASTSIFDPLERNLPVNAMRLPGHWRVTGDDKDRNHWDGYLVVEHSPHKYMSIGYFDWGTIPGAGKYHFEGTFDPITRVVRWTGLNIENRSGRPAMAHYEATLSPDGLHLVNGQWSGGISIPGTWTAEYIYEEPLVNDASQKRR